MTEALSSIPGLSGQCPCSFPLTRPTALACLRPCLVWLPCLCLIPVCLLLSYWFLQHTTSRSSPVPFSFFAGFCAPDFLLFSFYDLPLDNLSTRAFNVSFSPGWNLCCSPWACVLEWTISSAQQLSSCTVLQLPYELLCCFHWTDFCIDFQRNSLYFFLWCPSCLEGAPHELAKALERLHPLVLLLCHEVYRNIESKYVDYVLK